MTEAESPATLPQIFAHRGASADCIEHTRSAYLEAIAQGADGMETDVRLTADGAVVCWHDADVRRLTGVEGAVHELTLAQLRAIAPGGPDELVTLPQLLELLIAAGRPLRLALEIKQPSPFGNVLDEAVLACLADFGWDPVSGRLAGGIAVDVDIMCFWPQTVEFLAQRVGRGIAMLLLEDVRDDDIAGAGAGASASAGAGAGGDDIGSGDLDVEGLVRWVEVETGGLISGDAALAALHQADEVRRRLLADEAVALGPGVALIRRFPDLAQEWTASRAVRVWTVNDADAARACLDVGVRELTTDRPGALRAELAAALEGEPGPRPVR